MKNTYDFQRFIIKAFIFASPLVIILTVSVLFDPFKVIYDYDEYYKGSFISVNREFVCLKLYERNTKTIAYDSFIFGSSRSHAFQVKNWKTYLPPGSKGFHFDASGEGVYGIFNKIHYIDETGGALSNALIVVDEDTLTQTKNREGHLSISPPRLSKESPIEFYIEFFKPLLNLRFVIGYIDYSLFRTNRDYMEYLFKRAKYNHISDNSTGDLYYGYEKMIEEDKDGYYNALKSKGVFYDRSKAERRQQPVSAAEKELLIKVKKILDKHKTDYRIVVSPAYDQVPLGNDHLQLLNDIFGSRRIYNYSGENRFTESMYNYYEDNHYRPLVANEIMREIYRVPKSTAKLQKGK